MTRPDGRWESVHVYLPERQDEFLRSCVAPAVEDLEDHGDIDAWFFLRYWAGGPHLRLRVRTLAGREGVQRRLAEACRTGVTQWELKPLSEEFSQEVQPALSALESVDQHVMREPGTVELTQYEPEFDKYGGELGVEIAEEVFTASSRAVLDELGSSRVPARVLGRSMLMMVRGARAWGLEESDLEHFFTRYTALWAPYVFDSFLSTWSDLWVAHKPQVAGVVEAATRRDRSERVGAALRRARARIGVSPTVLPSVTLAGQDADEYSRSAVVLSSLLHTHNNRMGLIPEQEAFLAFLLAMGCAGSRPPDPEAFVSSVRQTRATRLQQAGVEAR